MKKILGTYDIIGEYAKEFRLLEKFLYGISEMYNFEYIKVPIIEETSLYHRDKNNTDDTVLKKTYTFNDLSGKSITLRPECNSGILRSVIENKLYTQLPRKFYYYGDVFRYDRPQKDRYREFTQFGYELIGSNSPIADAEMLSLAYNIYNLLGVNDITLRLNSLGNPDDINKYRETLVSYFGKYINSMCEDCKKRFKNNPLRILDCKDEKDKDVIKNAPSILDCMSIEKLKRFKLVLQYLDVRNIPYTVDGKFVRGIDYQNDTIFEILNNDKVLCSQNNLCGGGRYDNLYKYLANKNIAAFGFDFGLERLITSIKSQNPGFFQKNSIDVFVVNIGNDMVYCFELVDYLRQNGIVVEYDWSNNSFKSQLKYSDRFHPKYTIFVGEYEINNNTLTIRNNSTQEKITIEKKNIFDFFEKETGMERRLVK